MLGKSAHRLGRCIADGHQAIVGKDEADRRGARIAILDAVENADGHVESAALLVEAAGRFDLRHFLFGWHIHSDASLDQSLFFLGGLLEIDPGRILRNRGVRLDQASIASGSVSTQHPAELISLTADLCKARCSAKPGACRAAPGSWLSPSSPSRRRSFLRWGAIRSARAAASTYGSASETARGPARCWPTGTASVTSSTDSCSTRSCG